MRKGSGEVAPSAAGNHPQAVAARCDLGPLPPRTTDAAPDAGLLAAFAVLRRPQRPGDVPDPLRPGWGTIFVRYARLLRTVDGVSYYLVPQVTVSCGPSRTQTVRFQALTLGRGYSTGAPVARAILHGLADTSGTGAWRSTTFAAMVPDGITSVTLTYTSPRLIVTGRVVNNCVVITAIPRNAGANFSTTWNRR